MAARRSILVRLDTPDPVRLWTGHGPLPIPADAIELDDGAIYMGGAGLLSGFEQVEQLINGVADRLDIKVSGVTPRIMALYQEEQADLLGATLHIGTVLFDAGWQVSAVTWQAMYRADKLSVERSGESRTIALSLGSDDTGRSRSVNAFWTAADQRRRPASGVDAFFDHVSGINSGTSRVFAPRG